ncbi:MAG: Gldg family protein [Ruminococcus sp.]
MDKKEKIEKNVDKKPNAFVNFLKSRKARSGGIAIAITAVFICIIVLVNILAGVLVENFPNLKIDMTSTQAYQLQKDTVEYLSQIDQDITIYVLADEDSFKGGFGFSGTNADYITQGYKLLKKMAKTNSKIKLEFIELSSNPTFTNKYDKINWTGSSSNNLILIDAGDDNYTVLSFEDCFAYDADEVSYTGYTFTSTTVEEAVVTGVLEVVTTDKIGVDIITGCGEDETDYAGIKSLLTKNAYNVREMSILTDDFHKDAEIAIMYAPTVDLSDKAVEKLSDWLENDGEYGRTLIYIPVDMEVETPNIDSVIAQYGMKVGDGISYCTSANYYLNGPYVFLTDYESDIYTETLKNPNVPTLVGYSRDVEITDDSAVAMLSVESSVGVIPFDASVESEEDLEKYTKDKINLAAVGTKTNEENKSSNVAVFGSRYMFYEDYLSTTNYNNANYIVNFCNTVTDRGDMGITINSATINTSELGITNAMSIFTIAIIFIAVIPVTILLIGLVVFIRRRTK